MAGQAYRLLQRQLVTLKIPPGELVAESDLVEMTGIGRTPVREAIQRLSVEGLLQILPRKGLMVTPIRRSDLLLVVEARRVLARLLVVKAAERATPEQRQDLRVLAADMETSGLELDGFFANDRRLDELLEAACGNRYLVNSLVAMHSQCRRLWYFHRHHLNLQQSVQQRIDLARAVADNDGAGAIRALNEIIATLEKLVNGLDVLI